MISEQVIKENTNAVRELSRLLKKQQEIEDNKAETWLTNKEFAQWTIFKTLSQIRQARLKEKVLFKVTATGRYLYDLNSIDPKFLDESKRNVAAKKTEKK